MLKNPGKSWASRKLPRKPATPVNKRKMSIKKVRFT